MSRLAPNMFDRHYDDLVELGRSVLPSSAPAWTDHNAHDPGITLIELLAWIAEAQIYSLSKPRRDERQSYATLMGVEPHGARPARGLIWPNHDDPTGPAAILFRGRIIDTDKAVRLERAETPSFRPVHRQLWIPARVSGLKTGLADGTEVDHSDANRRGGPSFQPFGADEGRDAIFRMELEATGHDPLFEPGRPELTRLILGVRADSMPDAGTRAGSASGRSPIEVALVADGERIALPVVEDATDGMLRTGFIALDISSVEIEPRAAVLEFGAPEGLARSPRLLRIEPNVVPIIQRTPVTQNETSVVGSPDEAFDLNTPGLEFEAGREPVTVAVEASGTIESWSRTDEFSDCGPEDHKFALDPAAERITFGNGVNGARLPAGSTLSAAYSVTEGPAGNIAANRKWLVGGFSGVFGVNPDPTAGGEEASSWKAQRREARRIVREEHALVSARDFEDAARELAGLEVGRAVMMPPSQADTATGTMRLLAMRARYGPGEGETTETPRWLESVRARLASRVALGSRLRMIAPRYVRFSVTALAEAEPMNDPQEVRRNVIREIEARLNLVRDKPSDRERALGLPVTRRDLAAWIQALPDVRQVRELTIHVPGKGDVPAVELPRNGLPVFDQAQSDIQVVRGDAGGAA